MSMPFSKLSCPSCGYTATTTRLWGRFVYRNGNGAEAFIERYLGWCHDCCDAAPIEALPDAGRVEADRAAARAQLEAPKLDSSVRRLLDRFLGPRGDLSRKARTALAQAEVLAAVLEPGRLPRCLECGSQRIEKIALPDPETRGDRYDLNLAFRHPGCDAPLRMRDSSGLRIAMAPRKRVYDTQGLFIGHADPRARSLYEA